MLHYSLYCTMEYIHSVSLSRLIPKGCSENAEVSEIVVNVRSSEFSSSDHSLHTEYSQGVTITKAEFNDISRLVCDC